MRADGDFDRVWEPCLDEEIVGHLPLSLADPDDSCGYGADGTVLVSLFERKDQSSFCWDAWVDLCDNPDDPRSSTSTYSIEQSKEFASIAEAKADAVEWLTKRGGTIESNPRTEG